MFLSFTQLFAQEAQKAPQAAEQGGLPMSMLWIVGIFVVMYLVMLIPERRKQKKMQEKINSIKQGDVVTTYGGIVGTVEFVGQKTLYIKSNDSKIEILKQAVSIVEDKNAQN